MNGQESEMIEGRQDKSSEQTAKSSSTSTPLVTRLTHGLLPWVFIIACVLVWEFVVKFADVPSYLAPAPSAIIRRIFSDWNIISPHVWITLEETIWGFVLGTLIGFALAVLMAASRIIERSVYPLLIASQAVPKIAIAPIFIIWMGYGVLPKIAICALLVFFPVTITTVEGLKSADRSLLDLMRSVDSSPRQTFWKVKIPYAIPHIFAGLEIGITLSVVGAVVGEWVGAQGGLGYLILSAQGVLDGPLAFAAIILLVIMGTVLFGILSFVRKRFLSWNR